MAIADDLRSLIRGAAMHESERARLLEWVDMVSPPVEPTATPDRAHRLGHAEGVARSRPLARLKREHAERERAHQAKVDAWHGPRKPLHGEQIAVRDYEFQHSDS